MKANEDVRSKMAQSGVYQWELGDALGVSDVTICKWLRHPLDDKKKQVVMNAIEEIAKTRKA